QGNAVSDFREYDTFLYAGDDWKITQNLTLNLGLTWSYYGQPANLFHDNTLARESGPGGFWNPKLDIGIRTFPELPAPKNSFGPSVGFAYSPQWGGFLTGHGKTTFRGGYRLLYDPPFYNIYINMSSSSPAVFLQSFGAAASATKPLPGNGTGPAVRSAYSSFLQSGVFDPRQFNDTNMSPNFGPDRVHTWSFGMERELTKKAAIEARYVGNRGQNLFQSVNGNPDVAGLQAVAPNLIPAG